MSFIDEEEIDYEVELIIEALEYTVDILGERIKSLKYYGNLIYKDAGDIMVENEAISILKKKRKKLMKSKSIDQLSKHVDINRMVESYMAKNGIGEHHG